MINIPNKALSNLSCYKTEPQQRSNQLVIAVDFFANHAITL